MSKLKIKEEKGITLVALIITIIVLIILAAVTIITFTDSGLLETASKGTQNYANAQKEILNQNYQKDGIKIKYTQ